MNENNVAAVSLRKWIIFLGLGWLIVATQTLMNPLLGVADFFMNPGTVKNLIISAPIFLLIIPAKNEIKRFKKSEWIKWIVIVIAVSILMFSFLNGPNVLASLFFVLMTPMFLVLFLPVTLVAILLSLLYFNATSKAGKIWYNVIFYTLITFFIIQSVFILALLVMFRV